MVTLEPNKKLDRGRLLAALAELPQDRRGALTVLPAVLSQQGDGHATVAVRHPDGTLRLAASSDPRLPTGLDVPADGIVGRAAEERRPVYVQDTFSHPDYRVLTAQAYPVELALPVFERDQVVAVLNIERSVPYAPEEVAALEVFAAGVSNQLSLVSRSLESCVAAELHSMVVEGLTIDQAAHLALEIVVPTLGAQTGLVMGERRGRLVGIADVGLLDEALRRLLDKGLAYPRGLAWTACLTGKATYVGRYEGGPQGLDPELCGFDGAVLALPIGRHGANRHALCLHFEGEDMVSAADIALVEGFCKQLAVIFESIQAAALQSCLLDLYTRALESDTQDIYQRVLDAAVQHVPGAEAGSLLVRRGEWDRYRYAATDRYDVDALEGTTFSSAEMRAWYRNDDTDMAAGKARILSSRDVDLPRFSLETGGSDEAVTVGGMHAMKSTVCLPVIYKGQALAVINLDNFTRDDAFGNDSLRNLALFGPPVASLLAAAQHRDELVKASRTDPLTGLANRAGFLRVLEKQHARSSYSQEPYAVLVMDLTGFKTVNDTLGHAAGDAALTAVAAALESASRPGDAIGRWGGDEFVALLPNTTGDVAAIVAERLRAAVGKLEVGGRRLGIDIGVAWFPDDGLVPETLLLEADARMYASKRLGYGLRGAR